MKILLICSVLLLFMIFNENVIIKAAHFEQTRDTNNNKSQPTLAEFRRTDNKLSRESYTNLRNNITYHNDPPHHHHHHHHQRHRQHHRRYHSAHLNSSKLLKSSPNNGVAEKSSITTKGAPLKDGGNDNYSKHSYLNKENRSSIRPLFLRSIESKGEDRNVNANFNSSSASSSTIYDQRYNNTITSRGNPSLLRNDKQSEQFAYQKPSVILQHDVENFDYSNWARSNTNNNRNHIPNFNSIFPTTTATTPTSPYDSGSSPGTTFVTSRGRNYHKTHDGRHVCIQHKIVKIPIKTTEVFNRPTWKQINEPCHMNQMCTRVQLIHEPAVRDVIRHEVTKQTIYNCCPGWEQLTKTSNGCMKPICSSKCRNGGTCVTPDTCSCPSGFTGKYCERDINECKEEKPCDQYCYNTEGSYYCKCRDGFILQNDGQSCKKIGNGIDDAFEARDLENEVDDTNEEVQERLDKIEKMISKGQSTANELNKSIKLTSFTMESLKTRLNALEQKQQDISSLQERLLQQDEKTKKLEHLVNILFKCRTSSNPYCI